MHRADVAQLVLQRVLAQDIFQLNTLAVVCRTWSLALKERDLWAFVFERYAIGAIGQRRRRAPVAPRRTALVRDRACR